MSFTVAFAESHCKLVFMKPEASHHVQFESRLHRSRLCKSFSFVIAKMFRLGNEQFVQMSLDPEIPKYETGYA